MLSVISSVERLGGDAVVGEQVGDRVGQAGVHDARAGEVDRDRQVEALAAPLARAARSEASMTCSGQRADRGS